MSARRLFLAAAVAATALALLAGGSTAQSRGRVLAWQLALEEKLEQNVSCRFDETPMEEVVAFFRETLNANVIFEPPEGDTRERFVTLQLKDVPARDALSWVVRKTGMDFGFAYGAIYISTPDRVLRAEPSSYRRYDVSDLMFTGGLATGAAGQPAGAGAARELLDLIVAFTGPEKWDSVQVLGVSGIDGYEGRSREDRF